MKLNEIKGEKALDVVADLVEPLALIMADEEVQKLRESKAPVIKLVKPLLKNHKAEAIEILAVLDGEPVEGYAEKVSILTLPKKLLEILNDEELQSLFT